MPVATSKAAECQADIPAAGAWEEATTLKAIAECVDQEAMARVSTVAAVGQNNPVAMVKAAE